MMTREAVSMSAHAHSRLVTADASAPNWLTPQCTHMQSLRAKQKIFVHITGHEMTKKQGTYEQIRITAGGGRCNARLVN
jgi:hypothetical protein